MHYTVENFEEIKLKGEEMYKSFSSVRCQYFQDEIYFTALALEHLKFKQHSKGCSQQDQYMRFKLIHFAPEILRLSRTLQGIFHTRCFERVRMHSRTETILQDVTFYEFIAVLDNVRVKVVVKQIGNGRLLFWSIIPFWGLNRVTKERRLYGGNPEQD